MIKLKSSECAVLPLVLKGKWYDMIASGEKREEYRDFKPFWHKRLEKWWARKPGDTRKRVVAFSRGYRKADMFFVVIGVCCSDESGFRTSWGEPDTPHWVISLGRRVELVEG